MNTESETPSSLKVLGLNAIGKSGIQGAVALSSSAGTAFDDGFVVFCVGALLIRITRDRGQLFVDLGSSQSPEHFHQFDDVEIALGWRSIESVLAKKEPENIEAVLSRVCEHLNELQVQMSQPQERFTRARIERAARDRGEAFAQSLR